MRYFKVSKQNVKALKSYKELTELQYKTEISDQALELTPDIEDGEEWARELSRMSDKAQTQAESESGLDCGDYYIYAMNVDDSFDMYSIRRSNS